MIIGFDADQDCSNVAALAKERGASFVCRYLKNMTAAEAKALSAAGLQIVSIFESTAERALLGGVAGVEDGIAAGKAAAALGQPAGTAIYATADFGETAAQDTTIAMYFSAFKLAMGQIYKLGIYGEGAVCQMTLDAGLADYTWLAGGSGMRGTEAFAASGKATLVQDVGDKRGLNLGIGIDSDVANVEAFGGWTLGAAPQPVTAKTPAPIHSPAPHPKPVVDPDSDAEAEALDAEELGGT